MYILKNVYIEKLNNIVKKYNNTYHRAIKMRPVEVKSGQYIAFNRENNKKGPKFKVSDHNAISKYKKHFCNRLHSKLV